MSEGVCEVSKVCCENWLTFVLLLVASGFFHFYVLLDRQTYHTYHVQKNSFQFSSFLIVAWTSQVVLGGGNCQKGFAKFPKYVTEIGGYVFTACGFRKCSFRFSPESADTPSRFIMLIITFCLFILFSIVAWSRREICFRGRNVRRGLRSFQAMVRKLGDMWFLQLGTFLFHFFGIYRLTTQTHHCKTSIRSQNKRPNTRQTSKH